MKLSNSEIVESLRWQKFPVLADGFVTLVDVMGADESVVQAARVSYGKDIRDEYYQEWQELERKSQTPEDFSTEELATLRARQQWLNDQHQKEEIDQTTLIRYLMRHRHSTPFEMAEVKLLVRVPMDTWRQWIRHRTANVNEYSTRYTEAIDARSITDIGEWRLQSDTNRQGSSGKLEVWPEGYAVFSAQANPGGNAEYEVPFGSSKRYLYRPRPDSRQQGCALARVGQDGKPISVLAYFPMLRVEEVTPGRYLSWRERESHDQSQALYTERLLFGVAREQARKDLPLSTYTEAYWKVDLHNLLHFLALRMDSHAQKEIRDYANVIGWKLVAQLFPTTWEAFQDYRLKSMALTALDISVMNDLMARAADGLSLPVSASGADKDPAHVLTYDSAIWPAGWRALTRCRERDECLTKLRRLGVVVD